MFIIIIISSAVHEVHLISLQCIDQFVGNGVICGKDIDGDGYPDMMLDCDDPHCVQVSHQSHS